jgi:hypothetical protein
MLTSPACPTARVASMSRTLSRLAAAERSDRHGLRFTLFRNRLDRVFTCKRYTVRSGYGDADLDMLYAELSDRDIDTMPRLDPD